MMMTTRDRLVIARMLTVHAWRVLVHKWFVLRAGLWFDVPLWTLLIHDLSKLSRAEALGYAWRFCGPGRQRDQQSRPSPQEELWRRAWHHHWTSNPHHWEFWRPDPTLSPRRMPDAVAREMVADWFAAARAYVGQWPIRGQEWPWLRDNWPRVALHPETRTFVRNLLLSRGVTAPADPRAAQESA